MTENDRVKFNEVFLSIYTLFGKEPNDATTGLYFEILQEYDVELVTDGIRAALRSCKFFPKPAEIFEIIEGKENEHIDFAYQEAKSIVYHGFHYPIRLKNKLTMQTIADMGGLHEFYNRVFINSETDTAAFFEFKRIYKTYFRLFRSRGFVPEISYLSGYMNALPGAVPVDVNKLPELEYKPMRQGVIRGSAEQFQSARIESDRVRSLIQGMGKKE